MPKLIYEIKILIKTVSNHLRAKFGIVRRFSGKQFINRLAENFKPTLKVFQFER